MSGYEFISGEYGWSWRQFAPSKQLSDFERFLVIKKRQEVNFCFLPLGRLNNNAALLTMTNIHYRQLMKSTLFCYPPPQTNHHSFSRNLPPLFNIWTCCEWEIFLILCRNPEWEQIKSYTIFFHFSQRLTFICAMICIFSCPSCVSSIPGIPLVKACAIICSALFHIWYHQVLPTKVETIFSYEQV